MPALLQPATAEILYALGAPASLLDHKYGPFGAITTICSAPMHLETEGHDYAALVAAAKRLGISDDDFAALQQALASPDAAGPTAAWVLDTLVARTNALMSDPERVFECGVDEEAAMGHYFNQLWFGYRAATALAAQVPDGAAKLHGNPLWEMEDAQTAMDVIEQKTVDFIASTPSYAKAILMNVVREDSSRIRDELEGNWVSRLKSEGRRPRELC